MHALIVVESWFGNTRAVADAVADGLHEFATVDVRTAADAPVLLEPHVDLLVVGGPTHALGMSRPNTRTEALKQAGSPDASSTGVREWLERVQPGIGWAAAFDTRLDKGWVAGSAGRGIAKRLRRLGASVVLPPESFRVSGTPGPLLPGELDRARQWGKQLAAAVTVAERGSAL